MKNKKLITIIALFSFLILGSAVIALYVPTGGTFYGNVLINEEPNDPLQLGIRANDIFPDTAECPNGVRWVCWSRMNEFAGVLTNSLLQTSQSVILCANDTLNGVPTNGSQWNAGVNVSGIQYDELDYFMPVNKSLFASIECDTHNELRIVWQDYTYINDEWHWKGWYSETKQDGLFFTQPSLVTQAGGYPPEEDGYDQINWDVAIHLNNTYLVWQQNNNSMDESFSYTTDTLIDSHWDLWSVKVTDGELAQSNDFRQVAKNTCNQSDWDYESWWSICLFPQAVHTSVAGEQMHVVYEFLNVSPAEGTINPTYHPGKSIYYTNTTSTTPLTFSPDSYPVAEGIYGDPLIDNIISYWRPRIDNGTDENLHVAFWIWNKTNEPPFVDDKNVRYVRITQTFQQGEGDFSDPVWITNVVNPDIDVFSPDISCDDDARVTISFVHDIEDVDQDYINYTNKSLYADIDDWNEPYDNISWTNKYNIDFPNSGRTPQTLFLLKENSSSFAWHWYREGVVGLFDYNVSGSFWEEYYSPVPPEPPGYLNTTGVRPANHTTICDNEVEFCWNVIDNNNDTLVCWFYLNNTEFWNGTVNNNTEKCYDPTNISEGNWTWWVNCTDYDEDGWNTTGLFDVMIEDCTECPENMMLAIFVSLAIVAFIFAYLFVNTNHYIGYLWLGLVFGCILIGMHSVRLISETCGCCGYSSFATLYDGLYIAMIVSIMVVAFYIIYRIFLDRALDKLAKQEKADNLEEDWEDL